MGRRRAHLPIRRRIFVGCEGQGEQGYVRLINHIADQSNLALHFDAQLCNGGDHLAVVETAASLMKRRASQHGRYWKCAVFLDGDRRRESPERTRAADTLIEQSGFMPVWSDPCLEALLLLLHLPGGQTLRPPTTSLAQEQLKKCWPEYNKPMTAQELRDRIDLAGVRQAAGAHTELKHFLDAVGIDVD